MDAALAKASQKSSAAVKMEAKAQVKEEKKNIKAAEKAKKLQAAAEEQKIQDVKRAAEEAAEK